MASEELTLALTLVGIALLVVGIVLLTQRTQEVVVYLHPQGRGGWPVYYSPLPLRPIVF
jgi:hypothetical protein